MVGKQRSSTRALRIHNWQVLSATPEHCYSQCYSCVTELLAAYIGERTKFNFFVIVNLMRVLF